MLNITSVKFICSKAFTLAETLVVILIIGVVATFSIPALISNVQESIWKNAAKEAFSKSSQAVQQMRIDDGGTLNNYVATPNSFKPVFMKYFKVIKDCRVADCVPNSYTSDLYTSLTGDKGGTSLGAEGQFVTADGMFFNIQNSSSLGYGIEISVDVNGYTKKPNTFGKDTFFFQIVNDNLLPMGAKGTFFGAKAFCNKSTKSSQQGVGCMYNVMQGIDY